MDVFPTLGTTRTSVHLFVRDKYTHTSGGIPKSPFLTEKKELSNRVYTPDERDRRP